MQLLTRTDYFIPTSQAKLLTLLDQYCDPTDPILSSLHYQFVVDIEIPAAFSSVGCAGPFPSPLPDDSQDCTHRLQKHRSRT